jgi:surfactin synthase thioesterase subunit
MVKSLFGRQDNEMTQKMVELLERDLDNSPSPHSLWQRTSIPPAGVPVPLFVGGSKDDSIVDPNELQGWQAFLKPCDRLWMCPQGAHFFHYFQPKPVGRQLLKFWTSLQTPNSSSKAISP